MMGRKKIEIIQAIRGIAALGIVYFHTEYGPWRSANWGVDFFFILSGYFLMMSTKAVVGGGQYWKSKLRRICPLYYFMTIVVAIGCLLVPSVMGIRIYCLEQKTGRPKIGRKICITGTGASILLLFSGYYIWGSCA